jgi:hypothetical protein
LNEGDVFIIRKRHFRFEYAPAPAELASASVLSPNVASPSSPTSAASPAKTSPAKVYPSLPSIPALSSPAKAVRRRASHRLSLVPAGKDFVPLSPLKGRRHSTLGIQAGAPKDSTSDATAGTAVGMEEIIEGSEEDGSILDIVDGEDGETVYVEVTEEARAEIVQKVSTMASDRVRAVLLILSADPPESVYDASASPQGGTSQHQRSAPNTQATAAPAGNATSSCS